MTNYQVLAQSYTSSQRIPVTIKAACEADVERMFYARPDLDGFYVVSISRVL
jgi:hypothetical protein